VIRFNFIINMVGKMFKTFCKYHALTIAWVWGSTETTAIGKGVKQSIHGDVKTILLECPN